MMVSLLTLTMLPSPLPHRASPPRSSVRLPFARAALRMQSAYDDYADKIKEQLQELETSPGNVLEQLEPQRLVPERGNDGIGGRDWKKVSVMGAKLMPTWLVRFVLDAGPPEEEHERLFQLGVRSMRAGEYKKASTAFTQAVAAFPGGMTTRRGGEYRSGLHRRARATRLQPHAALAVRR